MGREKPACHRTVQYLKKGDPGPQGPKGPLPVPYGIYDPNTTYVCDGIIAPYVLCEGQYYVMNKQVSYKGATVGRSPKQDYAAYGSSATWILMEKYKAAFVELLMADFGKIASAIFYGSLMFSQQGTVNGAASSAYENLHVKSDGDVRENAGDFIPNVWINFLKGTLHAVNAVIKGVIEATSGSFANGTFTQADIKSGSIGGFEIASNWLRALGEDYGTQISPATIMTYANNHDIYDGKVTTNFETHPYPSVYSYFYILLRLTSEMVLNASDYSSSLRTNMLMYLKATGAKRAYYDSAGSPRGGNFAAWCEGGMFAGLRPHTRHINTSATLANTDHTIICNNASEITLTLPRYPEVGQTFKIWHTSSNALNVQTYNAGTRRYIYRLTKTTGYDYSYQSSAIEIMEFVYAHNLYHNSSAEDGLWMLVYYGKNA